MAGRRVLRVDDGVVSVAAEVDVIPLEATLHQHIAAHPEVLPNEELGLGPLVTLATEVDCGSGPIDLLACDAQGRIAIIEFKKGSENPDARSVIGQMLDYGSALWQKPYDEFQERIAIRAPVTEGSMADYVSSQLTALSTEAGDPETIRNGITRQLEVGDFTFVYVTRDLDQRNRRMMQYLAEAHRIPLVAVEVSMFRASEGSSFILAPQAAYVPTRPGPGPSPPNPAFERAKQLMDRVRNDLGLHLTRAETGWVYSLEPGQMGIGVYVTRRAVEFDLAAFRKVGADQLADELMDRVARFSSRRDIPRLWPTISCETIAASQDRARGDVIEPYFEARRKLSAIPPKDTAC